MNSDDEPSKRVVIERITRELTDQGVLLFKGWQMYRLLCLEHQSHEARDEHREAFYTGAEFVFDSIIVILSDGEAAPEVDGRRMDKLYAELTQMRKEFKRKYGDLLITKL